MPYCGVTEGWPWLHQVLPLKKGASSGTTGVVRGDTRLGRHQIYIRVMRVVIGSKSTSEMASSGPFRESVSAHTIRLLECLVPGARRSFGIGLTLARRKPI